MQRGSQMKKAIVAPVLPAAHVKQDGLDLRQVDLAAHQDIFVAVRLHDLTHEDLVSGKLDDPLQPTLHADRAGGDHGGMLQLAVEEFEQVRLVGPLAADDAAVVRLHYQVF